MGLRIAGNTLKPSLLLSDDGSAGAITAVATHQRNVYLGTDNGTLRHYHLFEDAPEYMLISEVPSGKHPVTKILVLDPIERAVVLSGGVASVYTLPELSTCNVGKLRDVNDMLQVSTIVNMPTRSPKPPQSPTEVKVIVLSSNKIRLILFLKDALKLLSEINYANGVRGASIPSKLSTICLVANKNNYDMVDLNQLRKIGLFEYNSSSGPTNSVTIPHVVAMHPPNSPSEYLMSIRSDSNTSIAMFIDEKGNAVRGTLPWIDQGYPESLVVDWPFVFGIFSGEEFADKMVISSLETLEVVHSENVEDLWKIKHLDKSKLEKEEDEEEQSIEQGEDQKVTQSDGKEDEIKTKTGILEDLPKENHQETEADSLSAKKLSNPKINSINSQAENVITASSNDKETTQNTPKFPKLKYKVEKILPVQVRNSELIQLTSFVDKNGVTVGDPPSQIESVGSMVIFGDHKLWLLQKTSPAEESFHLFEGYLRSTNAHDFTKDLHNASSILQNNTDTFFSAQLQLLILLELRDKSRLEELLLKIDPLNPGTYLVDPKLVIFIFCGEEFESIQFYRGIWKLLQNIDVPKIRQYSLDNNLISEYLIGVFKRDSQESLERDVKSFIRLYIYGNELKSSNQVIQFIDEVDYDLFSGKIADPTNKEVRKILEQRKNWGALIHFYELSSYSLKPTAKSVIVEEICRLVISICTGKLEDNNLSSDKDELLDKMLGQLPNLYSEKVYAKYLLEAVKLDAKKTLQYMKTTTITKFKAVHKQVMEQLNVGEGDYKQDVQKLKIEYLESSLEPPSAYDTSLIEDLFTELVKYFNDLTSVDSNVQNFTILETSYRVENSLSSLMWPQIYWIDWLHIHGSKSECQEYVTIYLKIWELLLYNLDAQYTDQLAQLRKTLSLFNIVLEPLISLLLEMGDFSAAEHLAINGRLPYPKKHFYFRDHRKPTDIDGLEVKGNLRKIFDVYQSEVGAIHHFIDIFGEHFSTLEILVLLPKDLPVLYFDSFFSKLLIDRESSHRVSYLTKTVSRAHARFLKDMNDSANAPSI